MFSSPYEPLGEVPTWGGGIDFKNLQGLLNTSKVDRVFVPGGGIDFKNQNLFQ